MVVLKVLLVALALTFTVSVWLYAYLSPSVSRKIERVLSTIAVVSCLGLMGVSTIIALAHI